ncbi:MAG: hypothetical protein DMG03_29640 [Acidobacteria bacterium]|nr:MAG: hypothetical protein DMG03_29640 [Acidobacteriota bacterium]
MELHRFLVCRDRSRCIVALVEMMREQELRVRFSNLVGRRVDDGSALQSERRQKECDLHTFELKNGTALKCATCKRVYPIKDDIPVMLIDEAQIEE